MANQNISVNFQLCWNMLLWAHQTSEINKSSRVWNTQCVRFWWACLIITNRCHSRQSEVTNHEQDFHLASCSSYFIWAEVDYSCDASVWLVYMYFFPFSPAVTQGGQNGSINAHFFLSCVHIHGLSVNSAPHKYLEHCGAVQPQWATHCTLIGLSVVA